MMTNLQLMGMARGVAAGMKYLAEIHFVHRVRCHDIKERIAANTIVRLE